MCLVLDATAPFGNGDRWVADHLDLPRIVVIVNKIDRRQPEAGDRPSWPPRRELDAEAYFPVSARTGDGLDALVDHLVARLPEGPPFFPDDAVRDVPEEQWVAELVREQLLAVTRDELPYSIATQVTEWEGDRDPRRHHRRAGEPEGDGDRQGRPDPQAGRQLAARRSCRRGMYLELRVKVDKDWQRRPDRVERLGY